MALLDRRPKLEILRLLAADGKPSMTLAASPLEAAADNGWPAALTRAVVGLGITQIIAWGSIYYSLTVLGPSITRDLGWNAQWTYVGFSVALLIAGLAAPITGRTIDRIGGRWVMTIGSATAAIGLWLLAFSHNWPSYLAAWSVLGVAKSMVLYEAAFATLTAMSAARARRAITYLAFFGGLASTVFWPLTQVLHDAYGWRPTLAVYGALALVVCLPLHALLLPAKAASLGHVAGAHVQDGVRSELPEAFLALASLMLSGSFAMTAFMWSGISVHLLSMLGLLGFTATAGVTIGVLIGPSQVLGRVGDMLLGSRFHPLNVLQVSSTLLPVAFLVLVASQGAGWAAALFAVLYGTSIGMNTIARGAVPLALFGPKGYGARLGRLAAPSFVAEALAPIAYAAAIGQFGPWGGLILAASAATIAWLGVMILSAAWRRVQPRNGAARPA